ncbi:LysR substrate-binding domain-containing protein [Aeromicrobium sp. UC242_57]|uniref:LysR substrate-binding domain-containing protein n=1 Tax=Aeromicrobium sp. UC242_57 TaxID=3374624 RepID=UPI0037C1606E
MGDLQREGGGETGHIRLAYTPAFVDMAVGVRDRFLSAAPDFSVSLVECWTEQAIQGVRDGTYQAGIVHTLRRPEDLEILDLGTLQIGVVVSSDDPLADQDVIEIDMLADKTLTIWPRPHSPVMYDNVRSMFEGHFVAGKVHEFGIFARGFFLDDAASLELVASGRGFSPAAQGALRSRPAGFTWRPVSPLSYIPTSLIYRESVATDPGIAGLLAAARRHARVAASAGPRS